MTWVLAFLMAAAAGCLGEEFPTQLIGTWMATSPSHQGRFVEISEEHIIFSSDESHSIYYTIHAIESIELERKIGIHDRVPRSWERQQENHPASL